MTPQDLTHRWPLVARPRPPCRSLATRIAEVTSLARGIERAADPLLVAAQALNAAALIASDCGLPELARELCLRHMNPYRQAGRLTINQARHMLEPAVNLARLHLRAGDAERAWVVLDTLHHAIAANVDAVIDGDTLPTGGLTGSSQEYRDLRIWAWRVYLAEGTRALVRLGRWHDALAHVERNKGIGLHLMDGRQLKIVIACRAGDTQTALSILADSTLTEPWEYQVAACLKVMCRLTADQPAEREAKHMIEQYLSGTPAPGHSVFRTRLGLTVVDLATLTAPTTASLGYVRLIDEAVASADGYVAQEVLAHQECRTVLKAAEEQALTAAVNASGLSAGAIPDPLLADLLAAVARCETAIERHLAACVSLQRHHEAASRVRAARSRP